VYPIRLQDTLPMIEIPLLPGDPAVKLDVQAAFGQAYDAGPYSREIDFVRDAILPPLRPAQARWAAARRKAAR
jgi:Protein of unknown function (DUF4058)